MIDLALVRGRMVALENDVPQAEGMPDDVPVYVVLAKLAGIDPATPGLAEGLMGEVARARILANDLYRNFAGRSVAADDPQVIGTIAFLQGVTFARAVADVKGTHG